LLTEEAGKERRKKPNHTIARILVLKKLFNTLCVEPLKMEVMLWVKKWQTQEKRYGK
jgi:hypothetical protein